MDGTTITQLIGSLGFPIAAAIGLFWYMVKEQRSFRDCIEENTKVLARILEHLSDDHITVSGGAHEK